MKLLLSNGAETITVGQFIKNNENNFYNTFQMGIKDDSDIRKQFINPFEMVLFEVNNGRIEVIRLKKDNEFDEVVYIG